MSHLGPPEHASAGARQIEHTADLALELWGPDEPGMLDAGARAVMGVLTEGASIDATDTRVVDLDTLDAEARVVQWLNEVLYWASVEGFVLVRAELRIEGDKLTGTALGREHSQALLKTEIKAATYHDLRVQRSEGRVSARVVLDV